MVRYSSGIQKKRKTRKKKGWQPQARPIDQAYARTQTTMYQSKLNRLKMAKRLHQRGWHGVATHRFDTHRSVAMQGRK